jgi:hypothetical protein
MPEIQVWRTISAKVCHTVIHKFRTWHKNGFDCSDVGYLSINPLTKAVLGDSSGWGVGVLNFMVFLTCFLVRKIESEFGSVMVLKKNQKNRHKNLLV